MCCKYDKIHVIFDEDGPNSSTLSTSHNSQALMDDYRVSDLKLIEMSKKIRELKIDPSTIGMTLLLSQLAQFISTNRYPHFSNIYSEVSELDDLVDVLRASRRCNLSSNLATSKKYGILSNRKRFNGKSFITVKKFKFIWEIISNGSIPGESFIRLVTPYHLNIVESIYILSSYTSDIKTINECQEYAMSALKHKFVSPIKMYSFSGKYWMQVPKGAVWFAAFNKKVKFSSYQPRNIYELVMDRQYLQNARVFGYIHNGGVYQYGISSPQFHYNWEDMITSFHSMGLTTPWMMGLPPHAKNIYFVIEGSPSLYKLMID